jgi:lysophospholipase L1-like esterase
MLPKSLLSLIFATTLVAPIPCMFAQTAAPAAATQAAKAPQAADVPAPKLDAKTGEMNAHFKDFHEKFLQRTKEGPIDILFLGDSITEGWKKAPEVWEKYYGPHHPANFGIGGDRTQHVLWRMDNGELDGISPKVVVLMIGTNNIGSNTDEQIIAADTKIVSELHAKLPNTKVLVLGIFPRGADPKAPKTAALRERIKTINAALAKLDDGNKTRYLDIGDKFLEPDGSITKEMMPDALHPTPKGYQIWADAIQPTLDEMMK